MAETVTSIEFYLKRVSDDANTAYVYLYDIDGYTLLGTSNGVATLSISNETPEWVVFTFDTPIEVSNNGYYRILLQTPGSAYGYTILNVYLATDWNETWDYTDGSEHWAGAYKAAYGYLGLDSIAYRINGDETNCAETTGALAGSANTSTGYRIYSYLSPAPADPLPTKAKNPIPGNAVTDVTLDQDTIIWEDGGGATSYNVYYGDTSGDLTLVSMDQVGLSFTVTGITLGSPYDYAVTRYWRIDSINDGGATEGDEWSFTTINFDQPKVSYDLITGGSGAGPYDDPPGVEGTDWRFTGENNLMTVRRLIAAANNKFWYEEL